MLKIKNTYKIISIILTIKINQFFFKSIMNKINYKI